MTRAANFGAQGEQIVDPTGPLLFVIPLTLVVVLIPILLATALVSRLRAPETNYRSELLSALGVRRGAVRVVAVAELIPACVSGAIVGWLIFSLVWRRLDHVPGTDYSFWPADTDVSWQLQLGAVCGCVGYTLVTATLTGAPRARKSTVALGRSEAPSGWWLVSLALAASLVTFASLTNENAGRAKLITIAAGIVLMVGLAGNSRIAIHRLSALLAKHARGPNAMLAGRRIGATQGAPFRLATGLALATLATMIAAPIIQELKVDPLRGEAGLDAARGYNLYIGSTHMAPEAISRLPGSPFVLPLSSATDQSGATIPVLYATCRELRKIVSVSNCSGGAQLIQVHEQVPVGPDQYLPPLTFRDSAEKLARIPTRVVHARLGDEFFGGVLMPPGRAPAVDLEGNFLVNLKDGHASRDKFEASLTNAAPTAFFTNSYQDQVDQAAEALGYAQIVQSGSIFGLVGLLTALIAAVLRSVLDRRRDTRTLSVMGVTQESVAKIHLLVQALPVLLTGFSAVASGFLLWVTYGVIDENMRMSSVTWVVVACVPVVSAAAVSLATLPAAALSDSRTPGDGPSRLWS